MLLGAGSGQAQTVSCESFGIAYRECRVGSSGPIRLVMEISERVCFQDLTWGSKELGVVWVRNGCRATFTIDKPSPLKSSTVNRLVCESQKANREVCFADLSKGMIFAQQLSQTACVEGKSWGYDRDRELVWVDHGCRAEFIIGSTTKVEPSSVPLDTSVICESEDGKRRSCKADTSAGVQIVRSLSDSDCGYRREWGYDKDGIWVSKGCRAEFVVRGKPKVMVSAVVCESQNDTRTRCAADTRYGVAVFRRLGQGDCILDETWGFDPDGIWVDRGCHAQFALGGYRLPQDVVPPNTSKVMCESLDGGHRPCPIDTSHGVGLLHQISDADCILNRTWGYDRDGIWVTNGCRAEFIVAR